MFDVYGVCSIATNTFFRHQRSYLQPTIVKAWHDEQTALLTLLKEHYSSQVILAVDGRSDSPGHCAKFGATSAVEQQVNKVMDVQLVQVSALWAAHIIGSQRLA